MNNDESLQSESAEDDVVVDENDGEKNSDGVDNAVTVEDKSEKKEGNGGKKRFVSIFMKIGIVAIIIGIVLFVIYFNTADNNVIFCLSDREVTSLDSDNVERYPVGSNVYFYIGSRENVFNATSIIVEISYAESAQYLRYKQISYEIEKHFKVLQAYIPSVYFKRAGSYKINIYLDNDLKGSKEIIFVED